MINLGHVTVQGSLIVVAIVCGAIALGVFA
jgi:hypothetical protein